MMKKTSFRCLAAGGLSLLAWPAAADDMQATYVDLTGSAGYSTHPAVNQGTTGSGGGAAFARLSVDGVHAWSSERTSTQLIGFWEGSEYFGRGTTNLVTARAQTTHALNERLQLSASAGFAADFSGELSNRFVYLPQPGEPIPGPVLGGPPPDLFLYGGRRYTADGRIGLTWNLSERSIVSGNLGVTRETYSDPRARDHTTESASASYVHSLSERTALGLEVTASRTDFDRSDDYTTIINPAATLTRHLSEEWMLSGSLGLSLSQVRIGGTDFHSTDPSFTGSLCHDSGRQRLCATASHFAQSSGFGELVQTSALGLEWADRLDAKQTIELSAGYQHYGKAVSNLGVPRTDQYHAAASYSRHLNERLSVGADVSARRFADVETNRQTDFSGSLFVRYRMGKGR